MTLCVSPIEPLIGGSYLGGISSDHTSTSLSPQSSTYSNQNSIPLHQIKMGNSGSNGIKPKTKVPNGATVVKTETVSAPDVDIDAVEQELCKITPNSIYLTFNAPNVDEYVGLFLSLITS